MLRLAARILLLPVIATVAAFGVADRHIGGQPFCFLTTFSIAIFFLGGQLFREALLINTFMVGALGLALAHAGWPAADVVYYTTELVITSTVGAFVYQGVERQLRRSFLERGLLSGMVARDGLTGLKNRGAFDDDYERLWQQAIRDRRALALLLIDVDHFKAYNDRYGHQAGRRSAAARGARRAALRAPAARHRCALWRRGISAGALRPGRRSTCVRSPSSCARPCRGWGIRHDDSPAGVDREHRCCNRQLGAGRSSDGAVQLADEALYAAKRGGRNGIRVVDCYGVNYSTGAFRRSA